MRTMRCSIAITVDGSKMWLATRRNGNPREVTLVDRNTRDTPEFYTTWEITIQDFPRNNGRGDRDRQIRVSPNQRQPGPCSCVFCGSIHNPAPSSSGERRHVQQRNPEGQRRTTTRPMPPSTRSPKSTSSTSASKIPTHGRQVGQLARTENPPAASILRGRSPPSVHQSKSRVTSKPEVTTATKGPRVESSTSGMV